MPYEKETLSNNETSHVSLILFLSSELRCDRQECESLARFVAHRGLAQTNQRKLHYDHSECPRCQWSGNGEKPALCQARRTWPVDLSYLFVTFSRERSQQDQKKEGKDSEIYYLVPKSNWLVINCHNISELWCLWSLILVNFHSQKESTCPGSVQVPTKSRRWRKLSVSASTKHETAPLGATK